MIKTFNYKLAAPAKVMSCHPAYAFNGIVISHGKKMTLHVNLIKFAILNSTMWQLADRVDCVQGFFFLHRKVIASISNKFLCDKDFNLNDCPL